MADVKILPITFEVEDDVYHVIALHYMPGAFASRSTFLGVIEREGSYWRATPLRRIDLAGSKDELAKDRAKSGFVRERDAFDFLYSDAQLQISARATIAAQDMPEG
jgi:hypothetical protein